MAAQLPRYIISGKPYELGFRVRKGLPFPTWQLIQKRQTRPCVLASTKEARCSYLKMIREMALIAKDLYKRACAGELVRWPEGMRQSRCSPCPAVALAKADWRKRISGGGFPPPLIPVANRLW